jgi:hypothetical protein
VCCLCASMWPPAAAPVFNHAPPRELLPQSLAQHAGFQIQLPITEYDFNDPEMISNMQESRHDWTQNVFEAEMLLFDSIHRFKDALTKIHNHGRIQEDDHTEGIFVPNSSRAIAPGHGIPPQLRGNEGFAPDANSDERAIVKPSEPVKSVVEEEAAPPAVTRYELPPESASTHSPTHNPHAAEASRLDLEIEMLEQRRALVLRELNWKQRRPVEDTHPPLPLPHPHAHGLSHQQFPSVPPNRQPSPPWDHVHLPQHVGRQEFDPFKRRRVAD